MHLRGCGVAVGAVLVVTLAACGGSSGSADPSSPLPITTTSASDSPTTSASATVDPNSDAAVIAGVRAWADALTAASQKPNTAPLIMAATNVCACITDTARSIDYLASHHLHLNVEYKVASAVVTARKGTSATAHVVLSNSAFQVLNADGSVYKQEAAGSQANDFSLKLLGQTWRVDTIF